MNIQEIAQAAADDPAASAFVRACQDIPIERLERLAAGLGMPDDWRVTDQLMARDGYCLSQGGRHTQQFYQEAAAQATACKDARRPAPLQDVAWGVLQQRRAAARPDAEKPYWQREHDLPTPPPVLAVPWWRRGSTRFLGCCAGSVLLGIILAASTNDTSPGAAGPIIMGILLIMAGLATPVLAFMVKAIQVGLAQHKAWMNSMPPSQREDVRRAEEAAAAAAALAANVIIHEDKKHRREHEELLSAIKGSRPSR